MTDATTTIDINGVPHVYKLTGQMTATLISPLPEEPPPPPPNEHGDFILDRTLGLLEGNLTGGGGMAALIDGVDSKPFASCARRVASGAGIISRYWAGAPKTLVKVVLHRPSDKGISGQAGTLTGFAKLYTRAVGNAYPSGAGLSLVQTLQFTDTPTGGGVIELINPNPLPVENFIVTIEYLSAYDVNVGQMVVWHRV